MRTGIVAITIVFVLLFIVSCSSVPQCPTPNVSISGECCADSDRNGFCDPAPAAEPAPAITPVNVTPPKPVSAAPIIEVDKPQVSDAHLKWISKMEQKAKSYQFVGRIADQYHGQIYVMGDRVRVDLDNAITINTEEGTENKINRIYVNTAEESALGVCSAGFILCKSRKGEAYAIDYTRYAPALPTSIFASLKNFPLELEQPNAEIIDDRQTTLLRYVDGRTKHNLFVDNFYGMPLRYRKETGGSTTLYEFKSMAFNTVVEKDFDIPILA